MFPPIDEQGKGAGLGGRLGEPDQTQESVLPGPREAGLAREPLGPCLKSGFSRFPLIRRFMAYLEGQGVICLLHVFSFILQAERWALSKKPRKPSGQGRLKQPSQLRGRGALSAMICLFFF